MQDDKLMLWRAADEPYLRKNRFGDGKADEVRVVGNAQAAVLFSAPHAVRQQRNGTMKAADARTGGLAEVLALHDGAAALTTIGPLTGDPNFDDDPEMPFKRKLGTLLHTDVIVLDLHGMKNHPNVDVCIGRGPCRGEGIDDIVAHVRSGFEAEGLRVAIDHPFPAQGNGTVTSFIQRAGVPALQLEIARRLRSPESSPGKAMQLLRGFDYAIAALAGRTELRRPSGDARPAVTSGRPTAVDRSR